MHLEDFLHAQDGYSFRSCSLAGILLFKVFRLKPENGHQMALEVVSGAHFGCTLHHFSSWTRLRGSWGRFRLPFYSSPLELPRGVDPRDS